MPPTLFVYTSSNRISSCFQVLMNILRGDIARLQRCTQITTHTAGHSLVARCKPLKYTYEKEIVLYAHFKKLDYFSTECIYSPNAYRGYVRSYIKDLEKVRPRSILDIISSGENMTAKGDVKLPKQRSCERCGYISSQPVCKGCVMLEGLNTGRLYLGIGKPNKAKRLDEELKKKLQLQDDDLAKNKDCEAAGCSSCENETGVDVAELF